MNVRFNVQQRRKILLICYTPVYTGCGKIKYPSTKTAISLKNAIILDENFLG